ncbi:MAG: hypothetical protein N2050_05865 [Flavobacteriales bacterium]|nr:hypothetical protein [Flavobacteriales bacterium]
MTGMVGVGALLSRPDRGFDTGPKAPTQPPHDRSLSSRALRGASKDRFPKSLSMKGLHPSKKRVPHRGTI